MYPMTTYSIAACDPEHQEWGVAVQSKFLAVGALVPGVAAGIGAVAAQAKTNSRFGQEGIRLMKERYTAKETITALLEKDAHREIRQLGLVDRNGDSAAFTGEHCYPYAGHLNGKNYSCQGNVLLGPVVLEKMEQAFLNSSGDLAERLLTALKAAQDAGGERRGQESAALIVEKISAFELMGESQSYINLRVDQHISPIAELNRLLCCHRVEYAQNHKNKYYPFENDTRYRLVEMMLESGLIKSTLPKNKSIEDVLIELGEKFRIPAVFRENCINGTVVDKIVDIYYTGHGAKYGIK